MRIANAPSISVGVIHGPKKEPIFRKSYGLRSIEPKLEADVDTAYMIGGCSQMITCAAIGVLVGDKKLAWDDPIRKHLPAFDPQGDPEIRRKQRLSISADIRQVLGIPPPSSQGLVVSSSTQSRTTLGLSMLFLPQTSLARDSRRAGCTATLLLGCWHRLSRQFLELSLLSSCKSAFFSR